MKRILITGVGLFKNKGEAAFTNVFLDHFKEREDVDICLSSCNAKSNLVYRGFKVVPSIRKNIIGSFLIIIAALISRLLPGVRLNYEELKYYKDADVIVDLSGDMLTEDYGIAILISHYIPIFIALILKKQYFICAQGLGPFKFTKPLTKYILNKAALITVREPISYKHLTEDLKIKKDNLYQTADLAFLLEPKKGNTVNSFLSGHNLQKEEYVSLAAAGLFLNKNRIHLNKSKKILAKAIDHIYRKYEKKVVLVSHSTGPKKRHDDRMIARDICNLLENKESVFVLENDLPTEEIKYAIQNSFIFIGMRMHANIAALSSSVPAIGLSYGIKFKGIFSMFGLDDFVIELTDLNYSKLERLIDRCFHENKEIRKKMEEKNHIIKQLARTNLLLFERYFLKEKTDHNAIRTGESCQQPKPDLIISDEQKRAWEEEKILIPDKPK